MKKAFILSILTILLSSLIIIGTSYALFTGQSNINIAVTSGKVDVSAYMDNLQYRSLLKNWEDALDNYVTFDNLGGSAQIDQTKGNLVLEKIVPGDAVKLDIVIINNSNIKVKYRVIISEVMGETSEMIIKVNDELRQDETISEWYELSPNSSATIVPVEIQLPISATVQGIDLELSFTVQAVQANGSEVFETTFVPKFKDFKEEFIAGGNIVLEEDAIIDENLILLEGTDLVLDMNGKTLTLENGSVDPMMKVKAGASIIITGDERMAYAYCPNATYC